MSPQPIPSTETSNVSTGPRTPEGKAVSSRNALKHGLASETMIMRGECPQEWEEFRDGMFAEWQPTTPTENALVGDMAKHQWLKDRAIRLQNETLEFCGLEQSNMQRFSLLMRYQTSNERSFARAKKELETMRKNRQAEFVSQNKNQAPEAAAIRRPKRGKPRRRFAEEAQIDEQMNREINDLAISLGLGAARFKAAS